MVGAMQKNLKVSILGKTYCLLTEEDDDSVFQAVELVDNLMKRKAEKMPCGDEKVAIVVALQLATDLTRKLKEMESCQRRIEQLAFLVDQGV